ncbi:hypothetical protein ES692_01795 [Psychroserpens burtonensis]|uniref:Lipocalin-like domain-containing protein n=1 Tax=Psychroserpens burtonensis TaxID=49278 RepID=A0A5C7BDQ1_9FLAO|nr:hypothetical protein [Psychroserpens burtonensis]TXE20017.1 hypothetical protein ES692_01795 [Psychroserpens burtonensis]
MFQKVSLILTICLVLLNSCAKEEVENQSQVIGEWKLINYSIGTAHDINKDGWSNLNLLNEIDCDDNEVLKFETTGVVSSNETYNPTLQISKSEVDNTYTFNIECSEGIISFATSFSQINSNTFQFNDKEFTVINDSFNIVLVEDIKIYNVDFSQIIETKDLVLTYTKL